MNELLFIKRTTGSVLLLGDVTSSHLKKKNETKYVKF